MTSDIASSVWTSDEKRSVQITRADGSILFVPADPANADYAALLAAGIDIVEAMPRVPPVPAITVLQALLWLATRGKNEDDVMAIIDAVPDQTLRLQWRAYWTRSPLLRADDALMIRLWSALGVPVSIDRAFREAALL